VTLTQWTEVGTGRCPTPIRLWHAGTMQSVDGLLSPPHLFSRAEVAGRPCPIPATGGVYAWYFTAIPPGVPVVGCHEIGGASLLYVGISPKEPPKNGRPPSKATLRSRIGYHYRGNAEGSTLRLTLGCLLTQQLGISLRRVGSGSRLTFSDGESALSEWMGRHAYVCWVPSEKPWLLEHELIAKYRFPLNLDQNKDSVFHSELSVIRGAQRAKAKSLPVLPR
jgi:hypothetical protein